MARLLASILVGGLPTACAPPAGQAIDRSPRSQIRQTPPQTYAPWKPSPRQRRRSPRPYKASHAPTRARSESDQAQIIQRTLLVESAHTGKAMRGHGDDLLALAPGSEGFQTITAKHTSEGNFVVYGYSDGWSKDLLVNEIDTTAESPLSDGTFLVCVEGDRPWTLQRIS